MKKALSAITSRLKSKGKQTPQKPPEKPPEPVNKKPVHIKPVEPKAPPAAKQEPPPAPKPKPAPVPAIQPPKQAEPLPAKQAETQGQRVPGTKRQRRFEQQVQRAKKAITSGAIQPKTREVSEHCECAYRTALSILATLTNDGVLEREGRGWKVRKHG